MQRTLYSTALLLALLLLSGCFTLTRGVRAMGRSQEILDPIHLFRDDANGRYAVVVNADYISQSSGAQEDSLVKLLFVADAAVQEGPLIAFDPVADPAAGMKLVPEDFGAGLDEAALKQALAGCRELVLRRSEDGAFIDSQRNLAVRVRITPGEEHRREHNAWWAWCAAPLYVPAVIIDVVILPVQAVMDDTPR